MGAPADARAQADDHELSSETADAPRLARARAAFEAASRAYDAGDYVAARAGFQEAYDLTENPAVRFNLGRVDERTGNLRAAAEHYRIALRGHLRPEHEAYARQRLEAVEAELARAGDGASGRAGGPDPVALGVTLGVGLSVTAALAVASAVMWVGANDTYDGFATDCAPRCMPSDVAASDLGTSIDLANAFWVAAIAAGVGTILITIALAVSGDADEPAASLLVGPTSLALRTRLP